MTSVRPAAPGCASSSWARDPAGGPLAAQADIAARDLADAVRLLLAQELFGQVPAA